MEGVIVTSVTGVTTAKCHACHAPRGRDGSRDTAGPPYVVRGPSCHARHAGLIFSNEPIERDTFEAVT